MAIIIIITIMTRVGKAEQGPESMHAPSPTYRFAYAPLPPYLYICIHMYICIYIYIYTPIHTL